MCPFPSLKQEIFFFIKHSSVWNVYLLNFPYYSNTFISETKYIVSILKLLTSKRRKSFYDASLSLFLCY